MRALEPKPKIYLQLTDGSLGAEHGALEIFDFLDNIGILFE